VHRFQQTGALTGGPDRPHRLRHHAIVGGVGSMGTPDTGARPPPGRGDSGDPATGPLMMEVIATVVALAIAVGLHLILRIYGSGLTLQNCRVIIGVGFFAKALRRRLRSMNDREDGERAKSKPPGPGEIGGPDTIMMLKRCFEAQYRSLQPDLRALLKLHGADLPFINNPIPAGICARATALWWTDDVTVRKEQRIFMTVKEDVFLQ
jgi:hypothetical protein